MIIGKASAFGLVGVLLLGGCTMQEQVATENYEYEGIATNALYALENYNAKTNAYNDGEPVVLGEKVPFGFRSGDFKVAIEKGYVTEDNVISEEYVYMQTIYRKVLDAHIRNSLGLQRYEEELREMGYKAPNSSFTEYAQKFSMMGLDFIYLQNTMSIERLDDADTEILKAYYLEQRTDVSEELEEMVLRTYKTIIPELSEADLEKFGALANAPNNDALRLMISAGYGSYDMEDALIEYAGEMQKRLHKIYEGELTVEAYV